MIDGDRDLLEMIRSAGTAMDRPREIGHFCYFPSEQAAVAAAEELVDAVPELSVEVYETDAWVVHAAHEAVLTDAYITQWRPRLAALAEKHGGEYDGWDADADAPGPLRDALDRFNELLVSDDAARSALVEGADDARLRELVDAVTPLYDEINDTLDALGEREHPLPDDAALLEDQLNSLGQLGMEAQLVLEARGQ